MSTERLGIAAPFGLSEKSVPALSSADFCFRGSVNSG